ncbi:CoA-binding protein [Marinigracilibium pacificum]|uniref:CoA-binding protein n=1 Tax=Marinigracilibium pacificum TaxID=2729599 RepID=A0A848J1K5_9BACT|nr:CoA-binding protein [Marinigracilibium pacificum]NMM49228.1 CoA-binding protein [Marinigracilibium pacificum]
MGLNDKKTVIIGATPNPARFAFKAADMFASYDVPFVPVGIKKGEVFGEEIQDIKEKPSVEEVHTVTMYIGPRHQDEWMDYIISLKPKRIIFNPGTENFEFYKKAEQAGIETIEACTLVMLSTGQF